MLQSVISLSINKRLTMKNKKKLKLENIISNNVNYVLYLSISIIIC